jgi:hypothetical protein
MPGLFSKALAGSPALQVLISGCWLTARKWNAGDFSAWVFPESHDVEVAIPATGESARCDVGAVHSGSWGTYNHRSPKGDL